MNSWKLFFTLLLASFLLTVAASAQWISCGPDSGLKQVRCLAGRGANLFAGTAYEGVFLSTNEGASWVSASSGLPNAVGITSFAMSGTNVFAGTFNGVYLSTNYGTSWSAVNTGLTSTFVNTVTVSGTTLFAGTSGGGIFRSTNDGASWSASNSGLSNNFVNVIAVSGSKLFAGTLDGVFTSTNDGASWTAVSANPTSYYIYSFAFSGSLGYTGTNSAVYRSTDNGSTWNRTYNNTPNNTIYALATSDGNLFAGDAYDGVFISADSSKTWANVSADMGNTNIRALLVLGSNLYAGTLGGAVWKRPLSEMITSVRTVSPAVPEAFALKQNYPNPFNPVTTIGFQVKTQSPVRLTVYNALGKEVAVLLNQTLQPGSYELPWNASSAPSGLYYYRLETNSTTETKSMMLMK